MIAYPVPKEKRKSRHEAACDVGLRDFRFSLGLTHRDRRLRNRCLCEISIAAYESLKHDLHMIVLKVYCFSVDALNRIVI